MISKCSNTFAMLSFAQVLYETYLKKDSLLYVVMCCCETPIMIASLLDHLFCDKCGHLCCLIFPPWTVGGSI